jgi:hypothetical protein
VTQTTTSINACDVEIWLDDDAGAPKNISGSSNSCTVNLSQNVGEQRTFGSKWPTRKICGRDCQVDLSIVYSSATDEAWDIIKQWYFADSPTKRTLTIYIPDKNVGSDKLAGEFWLETADIPLEAGEAAPIIVGCSLLVDGEFSLSTTAT